MAVQVQFLGRADGNTNFSVDEFIPTKGVTVTKGDFVYFSGGYITNSSIATQRLVGCAMETVVGDGTLTCKVCVDPLMRYLVDNDNDGTTFASTHVGTYFDLTGSTGAQYVDTSTTSSSSGQLLCIEYNPQISPVASDTSVGVFTIAESAYRI